MKYPPTYPLWIARFLCLPLLVLPAVLSAEESSEADGMLIFTVPEERAGEADSQAADAEEETPDFILSGAEESEAVGQVYVLSDFIVTTADDRGYYSANSLGATRTDQLIKNTPMTISVVNEQLIEDLNIFGIEDLATVVPSVEAEGESFSNRLLRFRGLLSRFQLYEFMPRQLAQDSYNVDRVEVIRGANSLIYGQAAPGGKANFQARRALIGESEKSLEFQIGSDGLRRGAFDVNVPVNEQLAFRIMGAHSEKEFAQKNKRDEFDGATLAVTYRPTDKTTIGLHVEGLQSYKNSPPSLYNDATGQYGYTGMLRDLPATPDIVDLLDSSVLNYILNYNDGFGLAPAIGNPANARVPDFFSTKQDLIDFYTKTIVVPDRSSVADTDPYRVSYTGPSHDGLSPGNIGSLALNERDVDGVFLLTDITHRFADDLQGKVAMSYEDQQTEVLNRGDPRNLYLTFGNFGGRNVANADGTGRRSYADGLFISPYWQSSESRDTTIAMRNTLTWDTEIFGTEQQLVFGFDYDRRKSSDFKDDLLAVAPDPVDGSYNGNDRSEDFFQIQSGTSPDGVDFNAVGDSNVTGDILTDPNASRIGRPGLGFYSGRERRATVEGLAGWIAAQGQYMDGRLNTLFGIRYDHISLHGEVLDVQAGNLTPSEIDETFTEVSPSLGVLFWINQNFGLFANYARSIESPNGWALNPAGESVPTETGEGFEGGVKFDLLDGDLTGQIIAFHITKENEQKSNFSNQILEVLYPYAEFPDLYPDATGPTDPGSIQPLGRNVAGNTVESYGLEVDLYYNPTRNLSIFLGYAYVDAEFKKTKSGILDGQTLPGTAHHNANLTVRYSFTDGVLKGWYAGINQKYRSRGLYGTLYEDLDFDGREDVLGLPGSDSTFGTSDDVPARTHDIWLEDNFETTVFAGWQGKLMKGRDAPVWNFQVTVNNAFDAVDLITTGYARYTEPRNILFKAAVKF